MWFFTGINDSVDLKVKNGHSSGHCKFITDLISSHPYIVFMFAFKVYTNENPTIIAFKRLQVWLVSYLLGGQAFVLYLF